MPTYDYLINSGVIVPDTSDTREEVIDEYKQVFGKDFIADPETPQGQWIDSETNSRQSVAINNANLANQLNPDLAGGAFLDAIWSLTGGQRRQGSSSTVYCTLTGTQGTIIPAGSQARTEEGEIFVNLANVTIPESATIDNVQFASENKGPIQAQAGRLNRIVTNILGWETVSNPESATLGIATQSDSQARLSRKNELAQLGKATAQAVISNVSVVEGVRSLSFRENISDSQQVIDGITLSPHSVWTCVEGGEDQSVALALLTSKTAGAGWNGRSYVTVTEPFSHQEYKISFDRPEIVKMQIRVTITNLETIENPVTAIRNSIMRYATGENSEDPGFIIGKDVSPFELSGTINRDYPNLFISLVEVAEKQDAPDYKGTTYEININQVALIEYPTDINVVVGN